MKRVAFLVLALSCAEVPLTPSGTPRIGATATAIDGCIYVIGGAARTEIAEVEAYRPSTRTWKPCAPIPRPRVFHAAAEAGGRIYIAGGLSNNQTLGLLDTFDPRSNSWSSLPPLPTPRSRLAAAAIGARLYVVGGMDNAGNSAALEIFDIPTGRWSRGADLPTPRHGLCAVALEGRLLAIGGYATEETGSVEEYDPEADAWRALAPLKVARGFFGAAILDKRVFVVGGRLRDLPPSEIVGGGTAAALPENNCRFGCASIGKKLYVIAGETEFGAKASGRVWAYDLEGDRWSDK